LEKLDQWYKPGDTFVSGSKNLVLADLHIAGHLAWVKVLWGEQSDEWQKVLTWNNGRWKALFDKLQPFEKVV